MEFTSKFNPETFVYLIHDLGQEPRFITAVSFRGTNVTYELTCGTQATWHLESEISTEKKSTASEVTGFAGH